ncbi:MAG: 3'(2'),5'-bisphosphate nucleotidase [Phycisphaeraceae bacterium]|nr:3'(2'),5'-bisphosphate nucleotidase [Phycisphaeraceae bacterium]
MPATHPYEKELAVAADAVRLACLVCQNVSALRADNERRTSPPQVSGDSVPSHRQSEIADRQSHALGAIAKLDQSPVTVADFASQAVICAKLWEEFSDDPVVAEEGTAQLRQTDHASQLEQVVQHASAVLGVAPRPEDVLDWIERGAAQPAPAPGSEARTLARFWTLDPIDGTKGYLRGEQYAVALALLEEGRVVAAALACPNLPNDLDGKTGLLLLAARGHGVTLSSLWHPDHHQPLARPTSPPLRFCESVESAHSDQSRSARLAAALGITEPPLRLDSQAKYALVARGQASIYLRLPTKADYRENIWDHAAGTLAVEEVGGRVTDIDGKPLDFTQGRRLENNRGIVATLGPIHERLLQTIAQVQKH